MKVTQGEDETEETQEGGKMKGTWRVGETDISYVGGET